jgi:hypothetical protein
MANHRTQNEIIRLAADTSDASNGPKRLSDMRTALFGSNRRTARLAYINTDQTKPHDKWEKYLRSKGINNSKYTAEERDVFHITSSYL